MPTNTLAAGQRPVFVGRGGSTEFAIITEPNYATSNDQQTRYIAFGTIYPSLSGDGPTITGGNGFYVPNATSVSDTGRAERWERSTSSAPAFWKRTTKPATVTSECYPNPIAVNGSLYPTAGYSTGG